jgi:RNA polymerase sigma-70 factor, ECF subfamily
MLSMDCEISDFGSNLGDLIASDDRHPAHTACLEEFQKIILRNMEEMPPKRREILTLRNVLNRSYDEIAAALGVNVGTVKSRLARARGHLRKKIEAHYPDVDLATDAGLKKLFAWRQDSTLLALAI